MRVIYIATILDVGLSTVLLTAGPFPKLDGARMGVGGGSLLGPGPHFPPLPLEPAHPLLSPLGPHHVVSARGLSETKFAAPIKQFSLKTTSN